MVQQPSSTTALAAGVSVAVLLALAAGVSVAVLLALAAGVL
jgi:hypothetical protein